MSGSYLVKYIQKAKNYGYKTNLTYVFLDQPMMNLLRVKARVRTGGHNVPEEDIIRRYYRSFRNFWHKYKDIVDTWEIYYNGGNDFDLIAKYISEEIEILDEQLYNTFKEILENEC